MINSRSGIIYINLPNDIVFNVMLIDLKNINFIRIIQTNEIFKIYKDTPNFVYKNIPFYVLLKNLSQKTIFPKCVIKSLKHLLSSCEI